eukprot:6099718-Prymnesium_polylepis.1
MRAAAATDDEVAKIVRGAAVDNTVFATFTTIETIHFTQNWCQHLAAAGVRGVLVGMMRSPAASAFDWAAARLHSLGATVYGASSPESNSQVRLRASARKALLRRDSLYTTRVCLRSQPQGGRWFHLLPVLRTGVRVILSDSDVVWLRDPRPYWKALEAAHPRLDFSISTDAQGPSRPRKLGTDLDIELWTHCFESMNLGILHFPAGARAGSLFAVEQMLAHLRERGNLRRVDQGPINYRWKRGTGTWRSHGASRREAHG